MDWILLRAASVMTAGTKLFTSASMAPMLLVQMTTDRVILETPPPTATCYPSPYAGKIAIRLETDRANLLEVVGTAETQRWKNGSFVRLDPGLLVTDGMVEVHGVLIPALHHTDRFRPDPHVAIPPGYLANLDSPATGHLGNGLEQLLDERRLVQVTPVGDNAVVIEEAPCAQIGWFTTDLIRDAVRLDARLQQGIGGLIGTRGTHGPIVRSGTPVTWEDGSPAGIVRDTLYPPASALQEQRWCYVYAPEMTVCIEKQWIEVNTL